MRKIFTWQQDVRRMVSRQVKGVDGFNIFSLILDKLSIIAIHREARAVGAADRDTNAMTDVEDLSGVPEVKVNLVNLTLLDPGSSDLFNFKSK